MVKVNVVSHPSPLRNLRLSQGVSLKVIDLCIFVYSINADTELTDGHSTIIHRSGGGIVEDIHRYSPVSTLDQKK